MGNRRLGVRRLEAVMDNFLSHGRLGGLNGSPFTIRDPDRVYLEEFYEQKPGINADLGAFSVQIPCQSAHAASEQLKRIAQLILEGTS